MPITNSTRWENWHCDDNIRKMHFTPGEDEYCADVKVSVCCRDEDEQESSFV